MQDISKSNDMAVLILNVGPGLTSPFPLNFSSISEQPNIDPYVFYSELNLHWGISQAETRKNTEMMYSVNFYCAKRVITPLRISSGRSHQLACNIGKVTTDIPQSKDKVAGRNHQQAGRSVPLPCCPLTAAVPCIIQCILHGRTSPRWVAGVVRWVAGAYAGPWRVREAAKVNRAIDLR